MNPALTFSFVSAIAIEVLFPIAIAIWIHKKYQVRWKFFFYGVLIFTLSQVLTRIPAMKVAEHFLADAFIKSDALVMGWMILAAFTAGLFEEVGRYLGIKFLWKKEEKTFQKGVMYGVGHGGFESILVGVVVSLSLFSALALTAANVSLLTPQEEQARMIFLNMSWWMPLLGGIERIFTLVIQVSFSIIVLQCFLRNNRLWLLVAIGYHFFVDLVAVMMTHFVIPVLGMSYGLLATEGAIAIIALFSLAIIFRLRKGPQQEVPGISL